MMMTSQIPRVLEHRNGLRTPLSSAAHDSHAERVHTCQRFLLVILALNMRLDLRMASPSHKLFNALIILASFTNEYWE